MSATWGDLTKHRGHLVVKHDSLGEILLQATEMSEARQVIFVTLIFCALDVEANLPRSLVTSTQSCWSGLLVLDTSLLCLFN